MGALISLEDLKKKFIGKEVYIPLYQRNYKWPDKSDGKKTSAKKLVEDLFNHWENCIKEKTSTSYHLGMLTIYKKEESEFQILDGQQRLITLTLIMKALGKIDKEHWFKLQFEREPGFGAESNTPRYNFIYCNETCDNSIDVQRMSKNYQAIEEYVIKCIKDINGFYEFIMKNVKILYRETKQEPIEEFLNMNFNKTPFCVTDYIKAYMVMDAESLEKQDNEITVAKIINLWKKLEYVLFKLEDTTFDNDLENEMFRLVKKNYTKDFLDKNRMEILFQDRYISNSNEYAAYKYKEIKDSLEKEYNRLMYYFKVMKSVLEEIQVVDENGNKHPNYNAYNAYNLLCEKDKDVHFFKLIDEVQNIEENIDIAKVIYNQFNLTETSHSKVNRKNDFNAKNQFMESMLIYENTTLSKNNNCKSVNKIKEINEANYINNYSKEDLDFFDNCYEAFNYNFEEYIKFIEKGKDCSELIYNFEEYIKFIEKEKDCSELIGSGKIVLQDLLENAKINQIKIPAIQRDYVMGSSKDYLKKYLQSISFYYKWSKFEKMEKNYMVLDKDKKPKEESKDIIKSFRFSVFENNTSYIFSNPLEEIDASDSGRRAKYNDICKRVPYLKPKKEITDFRAYSKGTDYGSFCESVNELYKDFEIIITNLKNEDIKEKKEKIEKNFNTSCIMGHLDDNGVFWVYDGQQRLTTSIVLLACLMRDNKNEDDRNKLKGWLKKFSFEGRDGANRCLDILLDENNTEGILKQMYGHIDDKTSFSIYKLIQYYQEFVSDNKDTSVCINPTYLLKGMEFEFAQVDSVNDAEQLFMELNEGLKLEPYEQYKAEFNYKIGKIFAANEEKKLRILRKTDNEWLDKVKSEENEIKYLQYCVRMACFEINGYDYNRKDDCLNDVDEDIIDYVERAMDTLINIKEQSEKEEFLSNTNINEQINTWSDLICYESKYDEPLIAAINDRLYFEKDFVDFVELYLDFAEKQNDWTNKKSNYYTKCFEMIKEFRDNSYLQIPTELKDEECKKNENDAEKLYREMLRNRNDRFNFDEISKWEEKYKKEYGGYSLVEKNKDKSYEYENKPDDELSKREMEYECKDIEGVSYEDIIINNNNSIIKDNLKYYFYKNKEDKTKIKMSLNKELVVDWISENENCSKKLISYLKDKGLLEFNNGILYDNQRNQVEKKGVKYLIKYNEYIYNIKEEYIMSVFKKYKEKNSDVY